MTISAPVAVVVLALALASPAAAEEDDLAADPAPPDIRAWRAEPTPGPEDTRWMWARVIVTSGKRRVVVGDRGTFPVVSALERALLQCGSNSRDQPEAFRTDAGHAVAEAWPDKPDQLPRRRVEAYVRDQPLEVPAKAGKVSLSGILVPLEAVSRGRMTVIRGSRRILLDGCGTCELASTEVARWLPAAERRACKKWLDRRRKGPPTTVPQHDRSLWVVYTVSVISPDNPALGESRRALARLGYDSTIANLACDQTSFAAPAEHEYMVAVYFASKAHARQFARLLPRPPPYVGKVVTHCRD